MNTISLSYPQLVVIIGFLAILGELVLGIQTGFDLLLLGSILVVSGTVGEACANIWVTLGFSSVLAFCYIAFGRNLIRQKIIYTTHKTNVDRLAGKHGIVVRTITPDTAGIIRIDDEDWRATSGSVIYEKEKCTVVSIEGVTLRVQKV
jgi:membrane protein implicated in regulation of membrane protease activity